MEELERFVAALAAVLAALTPLLVWVINVTKKARARSDTTITFLLRRGKAEAYSRELVNLDGTLPASILAAYGPLKPRLEALRPRASQMSDAELFVAIEDSMGEDISLLVCPALKVYETACIWIAMCYVKNHKNDC